MSQPIVQIHGFACRVQRSPDGVYRVTAPDGVLLSAEPSRFLAIARAALAALARRAA